MNPIDCTLYRDELQRLLGMFLQYKLESERVVGLIGDLTQSVPICIRCGSTDFQELYKETVMTCKECHHFMVYNHSPKSVRLIKNGSYWTYHSARALQPYNIKCPDTGEWGGW